jgi:TatD DNase family protein
MSLVDSHCHLEMLEDPQGAVDLARASGVDAIVTIGIDVTSSRMAVDLAGRLEGVYATVGLHPHDAAKLDDGALAELEGLARGPKVVGIGECGLDYYRDLSPRDLQRRAFVAQIALARRMRLPVVVHVRDAGEDAMELLAEQAEGLTVILHCFSLPSLVAECNARGYYASFAGNVTYKNAADLRAAVARAREDRVLLETDAPFLAPVPERGRANSPALVAHTAAAVGEARGWTLTRVAEATTENARRAFGLSGGA